MPNLINNEGNLTDVAANYRRAFAPFTLFGTRQLRFYTVYIYGLNVNHADNGGDYGYANPYESEFGGPDGWAGKQYQPNFTTDSVFSRAISAIQTQAEIYGVWHPDSDSGSPEGNPTDDSYFTVMVAGDTHPDRQHDDNFGTNSITLQNTIYNALYGTSCDSVTVREQYIYGDQLDWYYGTSIARHAAPVSLSQEEQAAVDAVKSAQSALRAVRKAKGG